MSSSEINEANIIMTSLDEIPGDARKAYKEQRRAQEAEDLERFLLCFKKERNGGVVQIHDPILPTVGGKSEFPPEVNSNPVSVTGEDVFHKLSRGRAR